MGVWRYCVGVEVLCVPVYCHLKIAVSIIFLLEIVTIFAIHVRYKQPRLFFQKYYFWYLMIVAVGSMVSAVFYCPAMARPVNVLVVFQVCVCVCVCVCVTLLSPGRSSSPDSPFASNQGILH